jgi:hypothetical protein
VPAGVVGDALGVEAGDVDVVGGADGGVLGVAWLADGMPRPMGVTGPGRSDLDTYHAAATPLMATMITSAMLSLLIRARRPVP